MYQHAGDLKTYEEARDRMKGMINNRMARNQPSPMDIGEVEQETWYDEDVAAVSASVQRHGCGGWGQLHRDCPTVAAGKGSKGKGKGKGRPGIRQRRSNGLGQVRRERRQKGPERVL